ncbi:phosphotransferase [Microbacterium sp. NPDC055903]
MTVWSRLDAAQRAWAEERLPDAALVSDMSWNLVESIVLHVRSDEGDAVIKAGGATNHHIAREASAHPDHTRELARTGHAARLRDSSTALRILLLDHLPGELVEGTDAERHPQTHRQAGALLRRLHGVETREDADYTSRTTARALSWLDGPHRVDASTAAVARHVLLAADASPVTVVPTHGDWQPRNWLIDDGVVRIIDFGRFAFRPAASDLTRLAAQQWRGRPDLEQAFFVGYGEDPRQAQEWRLHLLKEAIGTACWAFRVGDEAFEAQGHRMLAEVLGGAF